MTTTSDAHETVRDPGWYSNIGGFMAYEEESPSTLELLSIPFLLLLVVLYAPFWATDKLREKWRRRKRRGDRRRTGTRS